jgi:diadenosine tetraphosphatase ApaH/serine/threonine PP2A family protein phosphatase
VLALAESRLIINPGAIGQPRDGDPRASYAVYDSESRSITHYLVPYDIGATQAKMMAHRLPPSLARRLSYGV